MRGTLMKYVGDEVFAVWGAPLRATTTRSWRSSARSRSRQLTPELNRELVEQGAPEVSFGIGLNTGDAVAAHFGGGRRRQYDVVGDTVNVGARLCSAAGRGESSCQTQLLTRVTSPPPVEPVGPIELKGVSRELAPVASGASRARPTLRRLGGGRNAGCGSKVDGREGNLAGYDTRRGRRQVPTASRSRVPSECSTPPSTCTASSPSPGAVQPHHRLRARRLRRGQSQVCARGAGTRRRRPKCNGPAARTTLGVHDLRRRPRRTDPPAPGQLAVRACYDDEVASHRERRAHAGGGVATSSRVQGDEGVEFFVDHGR